MKKLYKLLLICLLIISGGMALKAQNVDDTFSIESKEDLITFADLVENNKSLNARLYADIDLEGGYWSTICETALYYNSYSNDANAEFYHEHSFTEDSNGFCTLCNGYEAAELVDGVYHIGNLGQLMWFANNVNTAHKVLLTADITIDNSVVWKPIGLQDGASNSSIFNGDGHTITFDNTNEGSVFGLFGTYNYSIIENLYLAGSITCNTTDNVGALVNSAYRTTIRNVISYVEVTNIGSGRAGGLAGQFGGQHSGELYSLIENCAVYANVTGNVAGGIIGHGWSGYQYYDIKNVAYAGDVTGSERQAAVIAYHGNNSDATKCKFENIYYCEKDALGFVGGGNTNYDLGTDVAAMTAAQFASGEVAYLLQGEQATQIWGQNIDNGETVQQYPVFSDAKVHLISCGDVNIYSNTYVEHSFNDNGFCNTCGNCEPAVFEDNYYNISNAGNLVWFSKHVNNDNFSANAKLMNDIEMNAVQWTPIGTSDAYNGTFDGQGHTINNLWHNTGVADGGREGLFTLIGSNGVVKNIVLNNATIWGGSSYGFNSCGGIAIKNQGTISNCIIAGSTIQFGNYAHFGGIAGHNTGTIKNCAVRNSILRRRWGGVNNRNIGGITQTNNGTVTDCYSYDNIYEYGLTTCAISAEGNAPINSYQYTTSTVADAAETARTKEQFASGEMAYLLQGEQTTQVWGQNIDNGETVQTYPVISDAKVYEHTFDGTTLYSNSQTLTAGGKCGDKLYWNIDDENTLTIFGTGAMYNYGNSSNKAPWRSLNPAPTSLVLEDGITHIGNSAFYQCSGFTGSLTIPNSVTSIGNEAFRYCSGFTGSLTIPNSVTTIGNYAFYDCNKFTGDLTIPNSVTTIGNYAFYNCSGFTGSLTIPNSVTTIGNYAFYNCSGFTGSLTIPNSVTTIGNSAFLDCSGFTGELTIPNSVTSIGNEAFRDCSGFTGSLTIPNSVTSIGNSAFYNCKGFTGSLTIGNSVTSIGYEAFYYCIGFTGSLTIPNSVTTIGNRAFYYCSGFTGSLTIPNSVTSIGEYAFYQCSGFTGSLTIPNSVTYIGNYAFQNCSGFNGSLTIPNSVTTIGEGAFKYCSGLTGSLTIGNSVTTIGESAFRYCSGFTGSLTIPNSVTTIGLSAFYDCSGFTGSLTIGNSVTTIGGYAFYNCKGFTEVYSLAETAPTLGENAFNKPNNATLYYPASSEPSYNNKGWFNYFSKCIGFNGKCGDNLYWYVDENNTLTIFGTGAMYDYNRDSNKAPWRSLDPKPTSLVLEEGITHIGNYAFYYCSGFNGSLTIPNSVTSIGNFAFSGCSGFNGSLTIGNSVTSIGDQAFSICEGFTGSLTIPNSVTSIGDYAFFDCYNFNGSLTIGNSVKTIGDCAFLICFGFTGSLTIPNSVTNIGNEAFNNCYGFNGSLTIGNSVTYIGDYAFSGCDGFTGSLTIGNSVRTIGNRAFAYCSSFTGSLTIPNSVTNIRDEAFQECSGFTGSLTIGNSVMNIGDNAFRQCYGFSDVYSFAETAPTLLAGAFDKPNNATLYYPASNEQSYDDNGWFEYFPQHIGFNSKCGDNLYWIVNDNTLTIFGTGAMYDYEYSGDNISPWRELETAPTSLVLEEGITHIGNSAFDNCSGFNGSLTIPNSVTTIGNEAFYNCSGFDGSLTIGNSVTSIGNYAFGNCSGFKGSLTIPNSVTYIANYAFQYCSGFTGSLTIPNSVTSIEEGAFSGCSSFTGSLTIGNSVKTIGNYAFYYCNGFTGSLTIGNSVKSIGDYAFYKCSGFTEVYSFAVTAPTLGTDAFDNPNNATLYYPASSEHSYNGNGWFEYFPQYIGFNGKCGDNLYWRVNDNILTIFGTGAMYDYGSDNNKAPWRSLNPAPTSLVLEEGITHIGNSAFCNCYGFKGSLTIPNSVTSIGNYAFYACFFTGSLTIPNSVTTIGNEAFRGCSGFTGSLTIPNSVTSIGDYAFYNCYGFTGDLTIGNSVRAIGDYAFWGCYGFTGSLTIPNSVTTIGNYAFQFCDGFTGSLTISNSVTTIGNSAFQECSGFTGSLTIPNSVTTIGNSAFQKCSGFTEIFFYRDANPTIATSTFSYINANAKVYAPVIWSSFAGIPSEKLVKMATFVGEQSADASTGSATINGWVGLAEDQTWPDEDDHVAINAPMVISGQQSAVSSQQSANSLSVKSFGLCGNENTTNGRITIEDGGQLYCEVARGKVTVKKEILGYQQSAVSGQQSESESKWYTIASPLKDTIQITTNSSFLTPNSDLYRYDEPSYTWQNAKNSANNGFNTIDPGRGYLYANAENTSLKFTGDINTETATYNLTAKSDVLKGFHLIGNPFTHDIYLGESIKTKGTQNIIFELNDSYGDGWNGAALNLSFSDGTPDKIITIESGNSKTETINVGSGVTVTVSFTKGSFPKECSFTIKYDDVEIICDKYSNEGSLTSVVDGETLTEFPVKEGKDILVNGYYTLTGEGAWTAEASTTEAIKPMQGILVKSLVDDSELKIYNTSRQPSAISRQQSRNSNQQSAISQQSLCISVSNAKYSDRAFVVFDKGVGLDKMNHENENIPLLYIPMEDADYAIAMMDMNVNEIPVNFETNVMGEYTISLRQENCEFDELYLLDKQTGEKVNILEQDYTFIATSSENPERFILMKDNGQQTTDNRPWVYVNNGDIVIYDIEGDADIKIFDALGRCVYQGESSDETTRIANGYSAGVYMIQKVDDKGVNVQKIIL